MARSAWLWGWTTRRCGASSRYGLAINLLYEQGRLVRALTRATGDGEDVTPNVKTIASIPHRLTATGDVPVPDLVEVR